MNVLKSFLIQSSVFMWGALLVAPAPVLAQSNDPHPYQNQSFFRMNSESLNPGLIDVIPALPVAEFKYRLPGDPKLYTELNTLVMFDKRNPLTDTLVAGGNFIFFKGGYMATIDADGFLWYKGRVNFQPSYVGGTYFINQGTNQVIAVDSYGNFVDTYLKSNLLKVIGGNYFIDADGILTTIKSLGVAPGNGIGIATRMNGWNFKGVSQAGGNFFVKPNGALITISSVTGFFSDEIKPASRPILLGGNYFVGEDCILYTVTNTGEILRNESVLVQNTPLVVGSSFLKLEDGTLVLVDGAGAVHRTIMHVSSTGVRAKVEKTFPQGIESKSIFLPTVIAP